MSEEEDAVASIVRRYADAARRQGKAAAAFDVDAANAAHDALASAYRELRDSGTAAQQALLSLAEDPDPNVRLWVGSHALEFAPAAGEKLLSELAGAGGMIAFNARMTLEQWRAGTLTFP